MFYINEIKGNGVIMFCLRLPKVVEEIESLTKQFRREQDKEFLINGQTFDQVNIAQKTKHEIDVQKQKDKKKEERRQMMVQVQYGFS